MKTKSLNVDMADFIGKFRVLNKVSPMPSPYLIPLRIFISSDELLKKTNIQLFYLNLEPDRIVNFEKVSLALGIMTGKIQRLTFEGEDISQLLDKLMNNPEILHKEIINTVFKDYILKGDV